MKSFCSFLLAPIFVLLFAYRYWRGRYDDMRFRTGRYTWSRFDRIGLRHPVGPVDLPARVWRRLMSRWWNAMEGDDLPVIGFAVFLWVYCLSWPILGLLWLLA